MARAALVLSSALLLLGLVSAQDVTLPNGIEALQVDQPTQGGATLGDQPTVTKPDEVFTSSGTDGTTTAGIDNGKPVLSQTGRKMLGRKMLGDLDLSGTGESVGDNTAGASVNAYGHGQLQGLDDSHIEPHGVQATADTAGQSTTTGVAADPDCVAREGPCAEVGRK